jgi:hypothetical protein
LQEIAHQLGRIEARIPDTERLAAEIGQVVSNGIKQVPQAPPTAPFSDLPLNEVAATLLTIAGSVKVIELLMKKPPGWMSHLVNIAALIGLAVAILAWQYPKPPGPPQPGPMTASARTSIARTKIQLPWFRDGDARRTDPRDRTLDSAICDVRQELQNNGVSFVVVLSGYDFRELLPTVQRDFGSNHGLAQQRGDYIVDLLKDPKCPSKAVDGWVVVRGPRTTKITGFGITPPERERLRGALKEDRRAELLEIRVQVDLNTQAAR